MQVSTFLSCSFHGVACATCPDEGTALLQTPRLTGGPSLPHPGPVLFLLRECVCTAWQAMHLDVQVRTCRRADSGGWGGGDDDGDGETRKEREEEGGRRKERGRGGEGEREEGKREEGKNRGGCLLADMFVSAVVAVLTHHAAVMSKYGEDKGGALTVALVHHGQIHPPAFSSHLHQGNSTADEEADQQQQSSPQAHGEALSLSTKAIALKSTNLICNPACWAGQFLDSFSVEHVQSHDRILCSHQMPKHRRRTKKERGTHRDTQRHRDTHTHTHTHTQTHTQQTQTET